MISHCDPAELNEASTEDKSEDHFLQAHCSCCDNVVDAVCPKCKTHVEPSGASISGSANSFISRGEYYRRVIMLIQNARNAKFTLGCYLIATGDAFADGVSMNDYARLWSVKKATVSKQCVAICKYLSIAPSRYMRQESTKENYIQSNRRPQKLP